MEEHRRWYDFSSFCLFGRVPGVDSSHDAGSGGQPFSTFKFIQDIMYVTVPHTNLY